MRRSSALCAGSEASRSNIVRERNQHVTSGAKGIRRGYQKNPGVWVDGKKIAYWNFHTCEMDISEEAFLHIDDMDVKQGFRGPERGGCPPSAVDER